MSGHDARKRLVDALFVTQLNKWLTFMFHASFHPGAPVRGRAGNNGGGRRLGTLNYVKWRSANPLN